jgi:hypothetical protein
MRIQRNRIGTKTLLPKGNVNSKMGKRKSPDLMKMPGKIEDLYSCTGLMVH